MMKIALKLTVFGILAVASLESANAGLFTNCKKKCSEERCAGDPDKKAECKKKCPKSIACQDVGKKPEREAKLKAEREAKQAQKSKDYMEGLGLTEESFAKKGQKRPMPQQPESEAERLDAERYAKASDKAKKILGSQDTPEQQQARKKQLQDEAVKEALEKSGLS